MRIDIRSVDHPLDEMMAGYVERRLRFALGRFETVVERVTVRVRGINQSSDSDLDRSCRVEVDLRFGERVECEARGADLAKTVDAVCDRIARAVTNHTKRHQKARMARVVV